MARKINTDEDIKKAEFKEQIHKCGRYIFLSIMVDYEVKIYKLSFSKNYSDDVNYNDISDSTVVDFTHCPYCGESLIKYE